MTLWNKIKAWFLGIGSGAAALDPNEPQDAAYLAAHENPTSDHELLELFDKGEFHYEPYVKIKTPEEWEEETWDAGREV